MEHDGLVIYMANKYLPLCDAATDFDDLVQAGRIGVMRAMATYEPEKGAFSTWAVFHIRNELRQLLPRMRPLSLDAEVGEDGVPLVDLLPAKGEGPDKRMERQAVRETVRERVALLPEEQRKAVTLHDLEGRSMEETAEAFFEKVLRVASGEQTCSERCDDRQDCQVNVADGRAEPAPIKETLFHCAPSLSHLSRILKYSIQIRRRKISSSTVTAELASSCFNPQPTLYA